jgi:hypothetical protein
MLRESKQTNPVEQASSITKAQAVRSIFIGSRIPSSSGTKDWVVLPKKSSRVFSRSNSTGPEPIREEMSGTTKKCRRMFRNLDAILDEANSLIEHEHKDEITSSRLGNY